jgi:hypothetical protein
MNESIMRCEGRGGKVFSSNFKLLLRYSSGKTEENHEPDSSQYKLYALSLW